MSDYPTPPSPATRELEPTVIVLPEDDKDSETISPSGLTKRDYSNDSAHNIPKASGPRTHSNRDCSADTQLDEKTGPQIRSEISPTLSLGSPPLVPSLAPEKLRSVLKRSRKEVEVDDESVTMPRNSSSILEDSGPISKKIRREESDDRDTGKTDDQARPSTSSHSTSGHLSAFPRIRPPPPPRRRHGSTAKPLYRDTMRIRTNPDTGEIEVFDYKSTQEYGERDSYLQVPMVYDLQGDLVTMTELEGPHFRFDRDAWKEFEHPTLTP